MSVDVSPDGKEIVFDLLGDIYTLPIGGGEARALTHGIAWEMQPRYSPDGKCIAFTSDQGGGDNIWVDGPRRQEPAAGHQGDLPPAQQPGLDARRRVHRGAQALHLAALARRRRDLALPPERRRGPADDQAPQRAEGRRRARLLARRPLPLLQPGLTPGEIFEYNKDPNGEIYVIQRLDRQDRRDRALRHRRRAARSGRRRRPTASASPSSAACAARACSTCRTSPPARSGRSTTASTATCRRPGRSTASTRAWPGRPTRSRSSSGPAARSAASTSPASASRTIPFHVRATSR